GRALDRFAVTIENGIVKVNTGKLLKRMRFEASQIVRP
ncbi:MAG: Rieske (2Fe-2S) protein, partial [Desulfatitalea sp.]|nr:Rieske (2Fe-2S) protein [Desulfatitalea sp.]